ncbi:MAG TPA: hypothetical protein VGR92_12765 [Steroidobacteraceae bacterium]|nr:hypothetical protein [Steroidobacteraceae bacterium]
MQQRRAAGCGGEKRNIMQARITGVMRWAATAAGGVILACSLLSQPAHAAASQRDGAHDFDWEVGLWKTHLRVLRQNPNGTTSWVTYEGTSNVIPIWNCRADMVELEATASDGRHVEAINLRLYDAASQQWSLNFANAASGVMSVPTIGEFRNGIGTFYDREPVGGREVLLRNVWSHITANSAHFEQAVSDDGGKTWTVNWIADDTRVKGPTDGCGKSGPNRGKSAWDSGTSEPTPPGTQREEPGF